MRRFGRVAVATAAILLLWQGTSFAALDKCQKRIQIEGAKLQKFIYTAVQKCADAIRKEQVLGATKGGTDCAPGMACLANAVKLCEAQLATVYDATNAKPGKSKIDLFRAAMEKARTPSGTGARECEDADLAIFSGMGHLQSGSELGTPSIALPLAPPRTAASIDSNADGKADSNSGSKFLTDFLIYSIENLAIKQAIQQTPDLITLVQSAVEADVAPQVCAGGVNAGLPCSLNVDCPTSTCKPRAKKAASCSPLDAEESGGFAYTPNLCRFGLQCRTATCNINSKGTCAVGGAECDASQNVNIGPGSPSNPSCTMGGTCVAQNSMVLLDAPLLAFAGAPFTIPIAGSLQTEVCRPGPTAGVCQTGGGACSEDDDCTGANSPPCNFFPGQGLGAAFGAENNAIYLINSAAKGITAPQPPIGGIFASLINSVCVEIVQSQGWCDCGLATGVRNSAEVCVDKNAMDTGGPNDECGAPQSEATPDEFFASLDNGPIKINPSGASTAGDCVDLVTLQFKLITDSADRGPDNIPCTDDDFVAPTATFTIPLTTGDATAKLYDVPSTLGFCVTNTTVPCTANGDCPLGDSCDGNQVIEASYQLGPISGDKPMTNACARYNAGDLRELALVSAAALVSLPIDPGFGEIPVDGLLNFRLACE